MHIRCNGKLIDLSTPRVMGILNTTPDSFYDGGRYTGIHQALKQAENMILEGADFIDVGGYSSRPGASEIPVDEEINRVVPVIEALCREYPDIPVSVDTFRSKVARSALDAGAAIINDIQAGVADEEMLPLAASRQVPYIMMHMRGNPQSMQGMTDYQNLLEEILFFFSERLAAARALGIVDCIADPGFGFAKTREQNFQLLENLDAFSILEVPLLAGLSRKSMIYKTLGISAGDALNGTTALHMVALTKGAHILRVHDVREAVECVRLWEPLKA